MQTAKEKDDYLQLFRDGDEKGFSYYFEVFYPAMLFFAFRLVKDKLIAENIVEESFVRLWKDHVSYETEKEIRLALYINVGGAAKAWISKQANVHSKEMEVSQHDPGSHLTELIRAEVTRKLYSAIRELPPFYKQVFKLIYIQGKTLKEASEELNISESTLKDHQLIGLQYVNRNGQLV
jgi:RNA polymerase sigma-70 factor (ECF subfamily)